jgi:hypothetical protein
MGGRIGLSAALALAYVTQLVGILLPAAARAAWAALLSGIFFGGNFMPRRRAPAHQRTWLCDAHCGVSGAGRIEGPLTAGYLMARQVDALFCSFPRAQCLSASSLSRLRLCKRERAKHG